MLSDRKMGRGAPTENAEAIFLAAYLRGHGYEFFHIANEHKASPRYMANLKKQGLAVGVPDYEVHLYAKDKNGDIWGFWAYIELKRAKKSLSRVSDSQKAWIERLNRAKNCAAAVCYGAGEAIEFLKMCEEKIKAL